MSDQIEFSAGRVKRGLDTFPPEWGTPPERSEDRAAWIAENVRSNPVTKLRKVLREQRRPTETRLLEAERKGSTSATKALRDVLDELRELDEEIVRRQSRAR